MSKSDTKAWVALIRTEHNRMISRFSFMWPGTRKPFVSDLDILGRDEPCGRRRIGSL